MAETNKITGFYDFHVTAEKAMDYFLQIDFKPEDVVITRFDAALIEPLKQVNDGTRINDHSIIDFFKNLFSSSQSTDQSGTIHPDREGYLITVNTTSAESAQLVKDALQHHGAKFVHGQDA